MKKILFFILLVMFSPLCVMAEEDHIYSIDMSIYIDQKGTAHITELWEVQAAKGKDWCKIFTNLENVKLNDVNVLMDEDLQESEDDTNDNIDISAEDVEDKEVSDDMAENKADKEEE